MTSHPGRPGRPRRTVGRLARACRALLSSLVVAFGAAAGAGDPPVLARFEVDMRAQIEQGRFDPRRDAVGLRGGFAPLSWQRPLLLRPLGDARYAVDVAFSRVPYGGQPVQYKFRIERAGQGVDDGWERGRNHALQLVAPALRVARAFDAASAAPPPRRTGTIERLGIVASGHVSARDVQVWLPPGYGRDAPRRYPVLYLQDGQNVFDAEAAGAEWRVDETAQRLAEAGAIAPPIIVAVASTRERIADYTPTAMPARPGGDREGRDGRDGRIGGGATAYARFLVEELKPMIDRRYRTLAQADATAVGGSSLGALVSLWLVLEHPQTFGAALAVSPALWWDDAFALRDLLARPLRGASRPRLWLDQGALEGDDALAESRKLQQALMARGWTAETLAYVEDPHGGHDEISWASRVEGMLRFLYGRRMPSGR